MRDGHGSAALQGCCVVVTANGHNLGQQSRHCVSSLDNAKVMPQTSQGVLTLS